MRLDRVSLAVLAIATLAGFASGCGDDDDEDEATTVTETAPAATTADGDPAVPAVEAGKRGPGFFSTPSGNIACHVGAKAARCDIRNRDWKPTPPPEPCELDYGHGIVATPDHAEFVCAGDTTLGAPNTLPYGEVSVRGQFACESAEDGVTCSHLETGHGFFLSRESFRIF